MDEVLEIQTSSIDIICMQRPFATCHIILESLEKALSCGPLQIKTPFFIQNFKSICSVVDLFGCLFLEYFNDLGLKMLGSGFEKVNKLLVWPFCLDVTDGWSFTNQNFIRQYVLIVTSNQHVPRNIWNPRKRSYHLASSNLNCF